MADKPVVHLRCNPWGGTSWVGNSDNKRYVGFGASLYGCGGPLPEAGKYTLRARRVWRAGGERVALAETSITLRGDP